MSGVVARSCPVCGANMDARRPQARYCSGACRAEASRLRRLLDGRPVDGFESVMDREARMRQRNRTERGAASRAALETRRVEA